LIADPRQIPKWAPGFADSVVRLPDSNWRATKNGQPFSLRVATNRDAGTADYLREVLPGREGGAYLRTVPRLGGGSVVVMVLPIVPGTDRTIVAATLRDELDALARLAEGESPPESGVS
jgi:hypothetical protein